MPGGLFCTIGNLLSDGTWTYTWEKGRQLKRMQSVDTDASFVYNENGLRVQKTVNGVVTNYTLHGKNIVHMTQGDNNLHFFYDASSKPAIVEYNGTKYAYVCNLQGDIVAILDSNGNKVVEYAYDAWGRPIKKEGSLAETLGTVQPFRYRGYVFDEETGVYYLRSRYYQPTIGRFTNCDILFCERNNLFCYCMNNPLRHLDTNGTESEDFGEEFLVGGLPVDKANYIQYFNFTSAYMRNGGSVFYNIPAFKNVIGEKGIKSVDYLQYEKYISTWQEDLIDVFGTVSTVANLVASIGTEFVFVYYGLPTDPYLMQAVDFVGNAPEPITTWIGDIKYNFPGHNHVVHELRIVRESIPDVTYCFSFEVCPCQKCNVNIDIQESKTYYRWK